MTARPRPPSAAPAAAAGPGDATDDDAQDEDGGGPDLDLVKEVRDAAIGMSRVEKQDPQTQAARDRRNARERAARARDRERGVDSERKSVADIEKMLAVAADPHTYELADQLPRPTRTGMQRDYPPWAWMLLGAGIETYGNAQNCVTQLNGPLLWDALLDQARRTAGGDQTRALRRLGPPDRHHWTYLARLWSADPDLRDAFHEAFRRTAVAKALAQGRLDPAAPFSANRPDLDHYVHADGVVAGSPSRALQPVTTDPDTGLPLLVRYDKARGLWWQGGDKKHPVHGSHFNIMWNRGEAYGSRLLMDVRHQPTGWPGGEGAMLLTMFRDLLAIAPGTQGVLTDGIWHDKHLREVFALGRVAISPVAAKRKGDGWRTAKSHALPDHVHDTPTGPCTHRLVATDGAVCAKPKQNKYAGGLQELEVVDRKRTADGKRFYLLVRIPCARAPGKHTDARIPLAHFAKDEPEFRRLEYLRLYAPGSDLYRWLYSRRIDAESGNRSIKRPFNDDRIPAWDPPRQLLVMLMKAHTINAVSQRLHEHPELLARRPADRVA